MSAYSLEEALLYAIRGQACLFLGAGFATLFTDAKSRPLPTAGELANEMVAACNGRPTTDLRVAATQLLRNFGELEYQSFLQQRFTVRDIAQPAIDIASEQWSRIYTTNFDDGFEKAATKAGKKVLSATAGDEVNQYLHSPRVCVHVHGFIDRVVRMSLTISWIPYRFEGY